MATTSKNARKGACLLCRKRKARCDGMRPSCGRCASMGHADECDYDDSLGRAENERLEASIARLETRILQLGGTLPTAPEVIMHEPHLEGQFSGSSFSSWHSRKRDGGQPSAPLQVSVPENWWRTPIPPPQVTKMLFDNFARHASQMGFFLNWPRVLSFFPPDPRRPLSPSLLNSILLFGVHLSGVQLLRDREAVFLERAIQSAPPVQPYQVMQNIQAETLLAHYFIRQGRFLEAMHRINTAASLSIGCGLHRLNGNASILPPTRDAVEQGERVNAFWTVMIFHKLFGIIMRWPSSVSEILDEKIDAPWPLDMQVYESGIVPTNLQRALTMKTFLHNPITANVETASSCLAKHAQAVALFEAANHIARGQINLADPQEYADFILFDHGLNQFIQTLPPGQGSVDTVRLRLAAFTLSHVAVIQLHSAFDTPESNLKCLNAARAVVSVNERIPNMQAWGYIDATMGTLWASVCQVFIRGIVAVRNPRASTRGWVATVTKNDYPALNAGFSSIITTMSIFSPQCVLIDYQLNRVKESYNALCR